MTHVVELAIDMYYYLRRPRFIESWFKIIHDETPGVVYLATPVGNKNRLRRWLERERLACYLLSESQRDSDFDLVRGAIFRVVTP